MTRSHSLVMSCISRSGSSEILFEPNRVVIAGWTGRDPVALEEHMAELESIGVARPPSTPVFYRVAETRLTHDETIQVIGESTSGEAECVLLRYGERWLVGVGSDHTDRNAESFSVAISKQVCDKPLARACWPMEEVVDHWDSLVLRSYATFGGNRELYQEGTIDVLLSAPELMLKYDKAHDSPLGPGDIVFGGTLAVRGEIRGAARFECELEDPVLGRTISHSYDIRVLDTGQT